jgi:CheY-like chemotaxis protein
MATWQMLIVDDNPGDRDLIRRALREAGVDVSVHTAENAVQALTHLRGSALPDVVLLDIRMPVFDGHWALGVFKELPAIREVPVIVLTSSSREEDRLLALRAGAAIVQVKPADWAGYVALARSLGDFLGGVRGPNPCSPRPQSAA